MVDTEPKAKTEDDLPGFGEKRLAVHNLMVSGQTSSLIITNSVNEETFVEQRDGNQKKKNDKRFYDQLRIQEATRRNIEIINQYLDDLKKIEEVLRTRIAENMVTINQNIHWIEEMKRTHEAAASALAFYEKNGFFERDETSKLKNKAAQRLLDEYIRRTGQTPESDMAISLAIQMQKQFDREEAERRQEENKQLGMQVEKDQGQMNTVQAEIEITTNRIEAIRNSGLSPEEQNKHLEELMRGIEKRNTIREVKRHYPNDPEIQNIINPQYEQKSRAKILEGEDDTAALSQYTQIFNQSAASKPTKTQSRPSDPDNKKLPPYRM
jgi:hypothetical protein